MRFTLSPAAACLAALSVPLSATADPAADYAALRAALPGLSFDLGRGEQLRQNQGRMDAMAGRWISLSTLNSGGPEMPPDDIIATACTRIALTITVAGATTLAVSQPLKSGEAAIRWQYAGGMTWLSSYDEAGQVSRLLAGTSLQEVEPEVVYSMLVQNRWLGQLTLIPAGQDLLLILPDGQPPELMMRCPG